MNFDGLRELATNGINKAVFNAFRMMAILDGSRLAARSSASLGLNELVANGVRGAPGVDVIATANDREVAILVRHYHDDDAAAPDAPIKLTAAGLSGASREVEHFRMDAPHGNAYAAWRAMGSPQRPSREQYEILERASQLPRIAEPMRHEIVEGRLEIDFTLPRHGVSLFRLRGAT